MEAIARGAGASTKTLYKRFKNKSDVLAAVVERNVARAMANHIGRATLAAEHLGPRDYLIRLGVEIGIALETEENAALVRMMLAEGARNRDFARLNASVTREVAAAIGDALRTWRKQGKIAFDRDPDQLASLCLQMLSSELRIRAALGDATSRVDLERSVRLAVEVFLRGIARAEGGRGATA